MKYATWHSMPVKLIDTIIDSKKFVAHGIAMEKVETWDIESMKWMP